MEFQAIDWQAMDIPARSMHPKAVREKGRDREPSSSSSSSSSDDGSDSDCGDDAYGGNKARRSRHVFVVHGFGRTIDGRAVALRLTKFSPYFFVRPDGASSLQQDHVEEIVVAVSESMSGAFSKELRGGALRSRAEARGFQGGRQHDFVCLFFDSQRAMKHAASRLRARGGTHVRLRGDQGRRRLVTYESTIDPLVRALHVADLQTAGWVDVRVDKAYPQDPSGRGRGTPWTTCPESYTLPYTAVSPHVGRLRFKTAPFVVAAYDIEAVGSSENFPVPVKDYEAIAGKLCEVLREAVGPATERGLRPTKGEMRGIIAAFLLMCYGVPSPAGSDAAAALKKYGNTNVLAPANAIRVVTKSAAASDPARLHAICWQASEDVRDVFLNPARAPSAAAIFGAPLGGTPIGGPLGGAPPGGPGETPSEADAIKKVLNEALPPLAGDTLTQIGLTVGSVADPGCTRRWIATLGTCSSLPTAPDATVVQCSSEAEVIAAFRDEIASVDPDVLCDYNGSNFDWSFMWGRALELGMASPRETRVSRAVPARSGAAAKAAAEAAAEAAAQRHRRARNFKTCDAFMRGLSRLNCDSADYVERNLSSSALGDNLIKQVDMPGRVVIDIYREVLKTHKLDSYKLDDVAAKLVGDRKHDMDHREMKRLQDGSAADRALVADYCVQDCALCLKLLHKLKIVPGAMAMASLSRVPLTAIFQRGQGVKTGSLVFYTCRKLKKLMRDMPRPPAFDAGREGDDGDPAAPQQSYKGATVQRAFQGLYDEDPVAVLDFASLYPSVIQSGDKDLDPDGRQKAGISYDNLVEDERFLGLPGYRYHTLEYPLIEGKGDKEREVGTERCTFARPESDEEHARDPGVLSVIEKDMLSARKAKRKQMWHTRVVLASDGREVVGTARDFVVGADGPDGPDVDQGLEPGAAAVELFDEVSGERHVVPLDDVASRGLAYTDAERDVMDCQQLSFKLTANSLYGQLGSSTSEIRDKRLAACVTTVGRNLIQWVVSFAEAEGPGIADRHFAAVGREDVRCERARVVYGDTDSVFIVLRVLLARPAATAADPPSWSPVIGKEAIPLVMEGAEAIAAAFTALCARPNVLEPEKTYFPLLLKGKKMYCGNLYPHGNPAEYKFSTMGLSTKRRDNAPISKRAINALLDPIMTDFDVRRGLDSLARVVSELVDGTVPLEDLIISKTLKGSYKNPDQIPHKTLAERMGRRDSGSKPPPNSRVPYIFVEQAGAGPGGAGPGGGLPGGGGSGQPLIGGKRKLLQGDRIEHPDYIRANRIKPDLLYYLETQIAGYAVQLLGVIVERLPGYPHPEGYWEALEREMLAALRHTDCTLPQAERRARVKIDAQRQGLARDLVFGPVIAAMRHRRDRQSLITSYFSR